MRRIKIAPTKYSLIEDALGLIFDLQPFMKTSSIAHKASAIGIKVGSRSEEELGEVFIEKVKKATAQVRKQSPIHYKILFEFYKNSDINELNLDQLGLSNSEIEQKWLESLECIFEFVEEEKVENLQSNPDDKEIQIKSSDWVVIVDGPDSLIGIIAQVIAVLQHPQIACRYFLNEKECTIIRSVDDLRVIL